MEIKKLKKNMMEQIKEAQIKLGYTRESIRLYYPMESILALTGINSQDPASLCEELCAAFAQEMELHPKFSVTGTDRIEVSIPPEGVEFVKNHVSDPLFLKNLIHLFTVHPHCSIQEIQEIFSKYAENYIYEEMPKGSDFDCVMYFPQKNLHNDTHFDEYFYCFKEEMGHISYHRFMKEDYDNLRNCSERNTK